MLILIAKCLFVSLVFLTLRKRFRRFAKSELENIPGPPSVSFWSGALPQMFDANGWDYHRHLWSTFGRVIRFRGMIGENMLYMYDPKALHHILVKDQDIFEQTPPVNAGSTLFFGPGLLSSHGDYHKTQRKLLNPVFSTSHMRQMMPIIYKIMHRFEDSIVKQVQDGPKEIDMSTWMGRTALELIGQGGFGHSFDKLSEDAPENTVGRALKRIMPLTLEMVFLRVYALHHIVKIGSGAFRKKMISILPWPSMKEARNVADVLHNTSVEIFDAKKKAILEGTTDDKDILSILLKANMDTSKPDQERPSKEEIYAQIATFLFAGTETTSNAAACTLWLLSKHKDVQAKLRKEIREAIDNARGEIPHDELVALPYLDAICRETLRLYVTLLCKVPTKDTVLPLSEPIVGIDGREMSEIFVPKGTTVVVGLLASNQNREIWGSDACEWKPERWLKGLPDTVSNARLPGIYSHLMTFSTGGRSCIGFKFSLLEMSAYPPVLIFGSLS
ncbi:cytochrome P450 [Panaeolus papilionaceus]|nr:cytochrome P450 [Panaeolus papilionaceus]